MRRIGSGLAVCNRRCVAPTRLSLALRAAFSRPGISRLFANSGVLPNKWPRACASLCHRLRASRVALAGGSKIRFRHFSAPTRASNSCRVSARRGSSCITTAQFGSASSSSDISPSMRPSPFRSSRCSFVKQYACLAAPSPRFSKSRSRRRPCMIGKETRCGVRACRAVALSLPIGVYFAATPRIDTTRASACGVAQYRAHASAS